MWVLFCLVVVPLVTTVEQRVHPPRDRQFQIQGVVIEEPHRTYRVKRQFQQPLYRQSQEDANVEQQDRVEEDVGQTPPAYFERPTQPYRQALPANSFGQSSSTFGQTYRQQPPQAFVQRPPPPQSQFQARPQQPPQQFPQPQFSPAPTWPANKRVFNDGSSSNSAFGPQYSRQSGGGIDSEGYNGARYYYPPKQPFPLPKCFYNPSGYVCCNQMLNDLIVETFTELEKRPKFHTCNVNALAFQIQQRAEKRFNHTFETIAAYDDFAQKIHFHGDFVCKLEINGKYMLTYGTVREAMDASLRPIPGRTPLPQQFQRNHHRYMVI